MRNHSLRLTVVGWMVSTLVPVVVIVMPVPLSCCVVSDAPENTFVPELMTELAPPSTTTVDVVLLAEVRTRRRGRSRR